MNIKYNSILGEPGLLAATMRYFQCESLLQELKKNWELILTEPVPEMVEFRPTDWWPISEEAQLGNSVTFLHRWFSSSSHMVTNSRYTRNFLLLGFKRCLTFVTPALHQDS